MIWRKLPSTRPNGTTIPTPGRPAATGSDSRSATTDVAINYFELDSGEAFSGGYHTHHDPEEIFYVQSGTACFETEDGAITVAAGEMIRFAPGEFQHGYNYSDELLEGFAFGAPFGSNDVEVLNECPTCGERAYNRRQSRLNETVDGEAVARTCPACGEEMVQTRLGHGENPK